jgi:hypothetical protein
VGFYTVNFQTALANANYAPTINAFPDTAGLSNFGAGSIRGTNNKTSSGFTFATVNYNDSAFADFQEVDIHVFGGY